MASSILDPKKPKQIILGIVLSIIAFLQLFPLLWLFNYSLQKSSNLFGEKLLDIPRNPLWSNYVQAWVDGHIFKYFINTAIVVSATILLVCLVSFCLSYACIRMQWKLKNAVLGFVLVCLVIPIHTTLLPNYIWFRNFNLIDSYWGLIIPYVAFGIPFSVMLFVGFIKNLPFSLEESAFIEGAGIFTILKSIIAPMTKSGFLTVAIMSFISSWNEFIMANTYLCSDDKRTLPFSIIRFEGEYSSNYAVQYACMMLVAILPVVIYFVFSKKIISGVTSGAVKG